MASAEPGLPALKAGLEASGRWALTNRALAQLLFWRPVPSFEPTEEALAPSVAMIDLQRASLADAVAAGQLGPGAASDEAVYMSGAIIIGVLTMAMANEPDLPWGEGRFTPMFPTLMQSLVTAYPPTPKRAKH